MCRCNHIVFVHDRSTAKVKEGQPYVLQRHLKLKFVPKICHQNLRCYKVDYIEFISYDHEAVLSSYLMWNFSRQCIFSIDNPWIDSIKDSSCSFEYKHFKLCLIYNKIDQE